ncbi:hypothetical protein N1851_012893 [Merluccius polli]|uniref:Uncharacterized protein n=1 Tax=Merluccius polli TaxID=89951 RepID=A0AA47MWW9_MERPO|nr:hypothetical protein N1851_012893 [Merluccius polli]
MTAHHLKLNKTELLFMPRKDCPHMDLLVTVKDIAVCPSPTAGNLVVLDNHLCCTANIPVICSLQHPQNPALPHEGSSTALNPSARNLPPQLLQLASGWTPCLRNQTFAAYPDHCSTPHVQPTKILPRDPPSSVTSTGSL